MPKIRIHLVDKKATTRVLYLEHKAARHTGNSETACSECAAYEYELMPGKMRRDSE